MKLLGVTGGIGSGKTTVCRLLEEAGARVFYADSEAKRLMQENPEARSAITATFGASSYDEDGRLNRAYLAEQVFGDDEKLERLNRIVHPLVFEAFDKARAKAETDGIELLVHEAALIFEAGGDEHLDAVAVVDAPERARIRRVTERDDVTTEQVRARMGHQLPPVELRRRADYIIDNSGSLDDLRREVNRVLDDLDVPIGSV